MSFGRIKPKRGVLLTGPPGTGKTTVGRALAHRLKSKFFMIDGTFITGTREFYGRIHQIFEAAKQNAPSIIFIDDSDVIFETGSETGLYRYLLTSWMAADYFLAAIQTVRANKQKYAEAETAARQRHPERPAFFDMFASMMPTHVMDEDD